MDIRPLTPTFAVSPQIAPEDVARLKEAGFTTVICNRPNGEVPMALQSAAIRAAAEAAGLTFVENPLTHQTMNEGTVGAQAAAIAEAPGPTLAYCASGTRSTIAWMLGAAAHTPPDDLLAAARKQGYDLEMLRPQLEAIYAG